MRVFEDETMLDSQFGKMLSVAKAYFASNRLKKCKYHQCIVLYTQQDEVKLFCLYCDTVEELVSQSCLILSQETLTTIQKILCMWEDETLDVPAYQFMKSLCQLNPENKKTEILLRTVSNGYAINRIVDIIG